MLDIDLELPGPRSKARVLVAMSGGVDSSVAAALVNAAGYETIGVTLQLYDHGAAIHRSGACCAGQDIHDAKRVAQALGIAHYVLDYESRFREAVIEPFAASYLSGETPVPCVACNQSVKFSDLLDTARQLGAAAMVTGHYVRTRSVGGRRALFRPVDADRDQSYFLYATTAEQLDFLRFPLGDFTKPEVRALAAEIGLSVAEKSDSQDICFVPQGRYSDVIEKLKPNAADEGDIVDLDGRVLGRHRGIMHYTVGQRRGLGISAAEPLFVVRLDAAAKRVIVGPREALATRRFRLRDLNWLGDGDPSAWTEGQEVYARVRSTRPPVKASVSVQAGEASVVLDDSEMGVAPGQACVFYDRDASDARVLGGGVIAQETTNEQACAA
ncbi:tRNA 2-thiouridine(34) synthase MnmA [Afifella marina]|uniref:tRNA-specific 2-thiouridylase MnmA n=1 Tax=Afifella marina DSM 2698 TaxID=1120955 RepID=A0A1G5P6Q3_AFIMA|nr:tRNA 2-thiouridine(34) synthase MnmA [Afifella marina]MBK1625149.1 tRNA 2-thiouridine(34) synthase MnmA [Afifella marina DSM 2698]MBK1627053.1 tRNA 2-thiouridine(34) synthase MnmA [Afifella marina]MBK5919390.1 tRNA 2-thiouridine(34) synthase MnmA [Afifella marina]RAI19611.1 tRNA 2-thiouridine(34) synthase MnmA [Afifella marina DSM 2698]SCZ44809.1 tRNA (5-methylaminomethyl-2-thiouridylate)-methyltransferase [Afifella marina DSM 2698]